VCIEFLPFLFCCQYQIYFIVGTIVLLSLSLVAGITNFVAARNKAAPDIITFVFSIYSFFFSIAHLVDFWCRGDSSAANGGDGGDGDNGGGEGGSGD